MYPKIVLTVAGIIPQMYLKYQLTQKTSQPQKSSLNNSEPSPDKSIDETLSLDNALKHLGGLSTDVKSNEGRMVIGSNFAAAILSQEIGGVLSIPGKKVSLYVPPGALQKPVSIVYIYITPPSITKPKLASEETWLTPIVECGPFRPGIFAGSVLDTTTCSLRSISTWWQGIRFMVPLLFIKASTQTKLKGTHTQNGRRRRMPHWNPWRMVCFTITMKHFTRVGVSGRMASSSARSSPQLEPGSDSEEESERIVTKWMMVEAFAEKNPSSPNQSLIQVKLLNIEEYWQVSFYWCQKLAWNLISYFPCNTGFCTPHMPKFEHFKLK